MPTVLKAQSNRLIDTHNWQYLYIKRLQQRGYLLQLNPTELPYTFGAISDALDKIDPSKLGRLEKRWYKLLNKYFKPKPTNVGSMRVGGFLGTALRRSSSARLNVINPKGEGKPVLPRVRVNAYMEWKHWIGQAGITFDWFYDVDPVGLDMANRLYIRSEGTYFGFNSKIVDIYIGRFDNQWSLYNQQGSFLTDNPRSFNQIMLRFGNSKISFTSILGELDSMDSTGTFTGQAFKLGSVRRYLFIHRLDWSPIPNLKLTFIEGKIYFSPTAGFSLEGLIPLQFLFFENNNKPQNNGSNIVLGGSIWYHTGRWTFFVQPMIGDVDLLYGNKSGAPKYPIPIAIHSSISIANILNRFDLGMQLDIVGTNTYRSSRHPSQWTYGQRGLATNFSDYIRAKIYPVFYPRFLPGLTVKPMLTIYLKGTEDLRDLRVAFGPNGNPLPIVLAGNAERTVRPSLHLRYQTIGADLFGPSSNIRFSMWINANIGVNFVSDLNHVEGATKQRFIGLFQIHAQIAF